MWYDFFSMIYDGTLERLYVPPRKEAFEMMELRNDDLVLDIACGTGQNFPFIQPMIGAGRIVGIDLSKGMLRQARRRCEKAGWENVSLVNTDIHAFDEAALEDVSGVREVDVVICALGFTLFDDWQEAFAKSYALLKKGGRFAIFDVHAEKRTFQTWATEKVSGGDLSRQSWLPLQQEATNFQKNPLPGSPYVFGGELYIAMGEKPVT